MWRRLIFVGIALFYATPSLARHRFPVTAPALPTEHQIALATDQEQPLYPMNYADEAVPYTRVVEFRHFNPERQHKSDKTLIGREYSRFAGRSDEPYYPIDTRRDQAVYRRYLERAAAEKDLHLGGRLGTYRYLDMHQAIGAALKAFETVLEPYFTGRLDSVSRSL